MRRSGRKAPGVRAARQRGQEPVCALCRQPERDVDDEERARMVRWWLEKSGLELDELLEIAKAIVPLLS